MAMRQAIDTRGDVADAMRVEGVGDVAFIWGKPGNPDKDHQGGYGLSKIVAKHGEGEALEAVNTLARGTKQVGPTRVICKLGTRTAILTHGGNGPDGPWLLTGYDDDGRRGPR